MKINLKDSNEHLTVQRQGLDIINLDEIVIPDIVVKTTYSELKALRDGGNLVAGTWYRITDYQCTTSQENTKSAGHQFDILVRADDESHLNENAFAAHHEGDIYFANSNLSAWELKYCLDNDTNRFAWAGGDNSGGDESEEEIYFYKTNVADFYDEVDYGDKLVLEGTIEIDGETYYKWRKYYRDEEPEYCVLTETTDFTGASLDNPIDGIVGSFFDDAGEPTNVYDTNRGDQIVEFHGSAAGGTGVIYYMKDEWNNECPYDFKNIQFKRWYATWIGDGGSELDGTYCLSKMYDGETMGFNDNVLEITDENDFEWRYTFHCKDSSSGEELDVDASMIPNNEGDCICHGNVIKEAHGHYDIDYFYSKIYLNDIVFSNTYSGNGSNICADNHIDFGCFNISFGAQCYGNRIGFYNRFNTFGNDCGDNTFGSDCQYNTFGNGYHYNTFGNGCHYNTFGAVCISNTFGYGCGGNTFGNNCFCNTFGNNCQDNTFGNNCQNNTFGNFFQSNTFGNYCSYNIFGNNCGGNTFGNNCGGNTFENNCGGNTFGNYVRQLSVFEGVQYCSVTGGSSDSVYVQNAQILNGVHGVSEQNRLTVTFTTNKTYTQIAGLNSSDVLKIWTPADLVQ